MKNLHLLYFTAQANPFQSIISYLVRDIYNKITKAFSIDTAVLAKYIYAYIPFFFSWLSRRSNKLMRAQFCSHGAPTQSALYIAAAANRNYSQGGHGVQAQYRKLHLH